MDTCLTVLLESVCLQKEYTFMFLIIVDELRMLLILGQIKDMTW